MRYFLFLFLISPVFADTIVVIAYGNKLILKDVEFMKVENNEVIFSAHGKITSKKCSQVFEIIDDNGMRIDFDCHSSIDYKNNKILSGKNYIHSGERLMEFRKRYYQGFFFQLLGQIILFKGLNEKNHQNMIFLGGGFTFLGGLSMMLSFNEVGEAGEYLIQQGNEIENENQENNRIKKENGDIDDF